MEWKKLKGECAAKHGRETDWLNVRENELRGKRGGGKSRESFKHWAK